MGGNDASTEFRWVCSSFEYPEGGDLDNIPDSVQRSREPRRTFLTEGIEPIPKRFDACDLAKPIQGVKGTATGKELPEAGIRDEGNLFEKLGSDFAVIPIRKVGVGTGSRRNLLVVAWRESRESPIFPETEGLIRIHVSERFSTKTPGEMQEELWLVTLAFAQATAFEGALLREAGRDLDCDSEFIDQLFAAKEELWWAFASYDTTLQRYYEHCQTAFGSSILHQQAMEEIPLLAERRARNLAARLEVQERRLNTLVGILTAFTVVLGVVAFVAPLGESIGWVSAVLVGAVVSMVAAGTSLLTLQWARRVKPGSLPKR